MVEEVLVHWPFRVIFNNLQQLVTCGLSPYTTFKTTTATPVANWRIGSAAYVMVNGVLENVSFQTAFEGVESG